MLTKHNAPLPDHLAHVARLNSPVISIYLNTHPFGRESAQDGTRFGDLVDDLEHSLSRDGNGAVKKMLLPLRSLAADADFWQHQQHALAIFGNSHLWETFVLDHACAESVTVDEHAYVLPLIPHIVDMPRFLILAVSKNAVRLFECDAESAELVIDSGIPTSFDDALRFEDPQAQLQFHSPGGVSIAHGHGIGDEVMKERLDRFLTAVDHKLVAWERAPHRPLIVAAVDHTASRFCHISKYPALIEQHIPGNPDRLSAATLHANALTLLDDHLLVERLAELERVQGLVGTGNIDTHTDDIAASARNGRVATLYLAESVFSEDGTDPDSRSRALNRAVIDTMRHGGEVLLAPMPLLDGIDAYAVTRW